MSQVGLHDLKGLFQLDDSLILCSQTFKLKTNKQIKPPKNLSDLDFEINGLLRGKLPPSHFFVNWLVLISSSTKAMWTMMLEVLFSSWSWSCRNSLQAYLKKFSALRKEKEHSSGKEFFSITLLVPGECSQFCPRPITSLIA